MTDYSAKQKEYLLLTEEKLSELVGFSSLPQQKLVDAMRYSLLNGGKRIRAMITLAFGEMLGAPQEEALLCACAIEMVHAYSLIHDDLPCMDDDDFRRGKPSCHKQFDEATAVLAGDSLLTLAFAVLSRLPANKSGRAVQILADAAGVLGMTGGQMMDIELGASVRSAEELEAIDRRKTGALIRAAAALGCLAANAEENTFKAADEYAKRIGLSFQIVDDILDITPGQNEGEYVFPEGEPSYAALFGVEESRRLCAQLTEEAVAHLCIFSDAADFLRAFALYLQNRVI